jgi:hypothetical protein
MVQQASPRDAEALVARLSRLMTLRAKLILAFSMVASVPLVFGAPRRRAP